MDGEPASVPTYRIFRDKHGIPQFEPKRGTQALKDALIYSFPTLETELQLMQAALRKFFDSERGSKFVFELPHNDLQISLTKTKNVEVSPVQIGKASLKSWKPQQRASRTSSRASSRASSRPPSRALSRVSSRADMPNIRPETPVDLNPRGRMTTWILSNGQELEGRKRQPYDPIKRRKVAENRGNACEKHRISKTACDPNVCPHNKLYSKAADEASKENGVLIGDISQGPLSSVNESEKNGSPDTCIPVSSNVADSSFSNVTGTDDASILDKEEVFWDNSEATTTTFDPDNSLLCFGHASTNNQPSPWTDGSHTSSSFSLTSWSSHASIREAIPERSDFLSSIGASETLETCIQEETGVQRLEECHISSQNHGSGTHQHCIPPLVGVLNQTNSELPLEDSEKDLHWTPSCESEKPFKCSEDPFMGWATKRSSQIYADYGWVLSHVETL